jgi:hypothetical protein
MFDIYRGFLQSLDENSGIVPSYLPPKSFSLYYSSIILPFDAIRRRKASHKGRGLAAKSSRTSI